MDQQALETIWSGSGPGLLGPAVESCGGGVVAWAVCTQTPERCLKLDCHPVQAKLTG